MGQLVPQNQFELLDRPAAQGGRWQQDDRPQDTDQHGRGQVVADADYDLPAYAKRAPDVDRAGGSRPIQSHGFVSYIVQPRSGRTPGARTSQANRRARPKGVAAPA